MSASIALLQALARLDGEYAAAGRGAELEVLRMFLWDTDDAVLYANLAAPLNSTECGIPKGYAPAGWSMQGAPAK